MKKALFTDSSSSIMSTIFLNNHQFRFKAISLLSRTFPDNYGLLITRMYCISFVNIFFFILSIKGAASGTFSTLMQHYHSR